MKVNTHLDIIATVTEIQETFYMSWGDPNRFDDWETPAKVLFIELSEEDKKKGYCLEKLTIWLGRYEINTGTRPSIKGTELEGLEKGLRIRIHGPLYRADIAYGWGEYPLTEEAEEAFGIPGTIRVFSHERPIDESAIKKMPKLSLKTAREANALLREHPISKMSAKTDWTTFISELESQANGLQTPSERSRALSGVSLSLADSGNMDNAVRSAQKSLDIARSLPWKDGVMSRAIASIVFARAGNVEIALSEIDSVLIEYPEEFAKHHDVIEFEELKVQVTKAAGMIGAWVQSQDRIRKAFDTSDRISETRERPYAFQKQQCAIPIAVSSISAELRDESLLKLAVELSDKIDDPGYRIQAYTGILLAAGFMKASNLADELVNKVNLGLPSITPSLDRFYSMMDFSASLIQIDYIEAGLNLLDRAREFAPDFREEYNPGWSALMFAKILNHIGHPELEEAAKEYLDMSSDVARRNIEALFQYSSYIRISDINNAFMVLGGLVELLEIDDALTLVQSLPEKLNGVPDVGVREHGLVRAVWLLSKIAIREYNQQTMNKAISFLSKFQDEWYKATAIARISQVCADGISPKRWWHLIDPQTGFF